MNYLEKSLCVTLLFLTLPRTFTLSERHGHHGPRTGDQQTLRTSRYMTSQGIPRDVGDLKACTSLNKNLGRHRRAASTLLSEAVIDNRSIRAEDGFGKAVYFTGSPEVLLAKMAGPVIPRHHFTVTLWLQPEGGQMDPVSILEMYDTCSSTSGWSVGIRTADGDGEKEAVFYFELRSDRSRTPSLIISHKRVEPARWVHMAAVYDGRHLSLYVDGARVANGRGQRGPLFSAVSSHCKILTLGGQHVEGKYFRGKLDELRLWDQVLHQGDIVKSMSTSPDKSDNLGPGTLILHESFDAHDSLKFRGQPTLVPSDLTDKKHDLRIQVPPCGVTICDDPEVIQSYTSHWQLRTSKTIKYSVINLRNDEGGNPTVEAEQIKLQDRALREAFLPHNISFRLTDTIAISNTSLRMRVILPDCDPDKIGDDICHPECRHIATGNDGGDCDTQPSSCDVTQLGNGHCDPGCNRRYHGWDAGDCCDPDVTNTSATCYDPSSNHRAYLSITEYKGLIGVSSMTQLSVFLSRWTSGDLLGDATFPWDKNVHGVLGGLVLNPDLYGTPGKTDNMVHEVGHVFGLWHVHHGVSEMACDDPCLEVSPSLGLGDLVADTPPTPTNAHCGEPAQDGAACGFASFTNTPFKNYMAYSDDSCMTHFTPQQSARMHCYMDLTYQRWMTDLRPSPVPLPPRVMAAELDDVSIAWIPPIGRGAAALHEICRNCRADRSLVQYGSSARASVPSLGRTNWSPAQATGAPDAKACTASGYAWRPDVTSCYDSCFIEIGFEHPVVPRRLSIWITLNVANSIRQVELLFKDGSEHQLRPVHAQCDVPYTTWLTMTKLLTKVRVYVRGPEVGVDAVMVESGPEHSGCQACPGVQFAVTRQPPFATGSVIVGTPFYQDRTVIIGSNYTYSIQTMLGSKLSEASPPLLYTHGAPFCGDGKLNRETEDCDDGNAVTGDGCDLTCHTEDTFHCQGEPSLCTQRDGDGLCEESEKKSSIRDCGFFTPEGAVDQWAVTADANPLYQSALCRERAVLGPPSLDLKCRVGQFVADLLWHPCESPLADADFWLKVSFPRAVVATSVLVYGHKVNSDILPHPLTVMLVDVNNHTHTTGSDFIRLDCSTLPLVFNVHHDLSRKFFLTKAVKVSFRSPWVGISAVALRSRRDLNHVTSVVCSGDQLYNPHTERCVPYRCQRPLCDQYRIKYGNVTCSGSQEGDSCNVRCHPGYELNLGLSEVVCSEGEWRGSARCVAVDCGVPMVAHARLDCPDGHTYGKRCKLECKSPARKNGTGNIVRCEDDGMWSLPEAFCQVMCAGRPLVKNASLNSKHCSTPGDRQVGTRCRFRCNKGFHVRGQAISRRVLRYVCTEAGLWLGPDCERLYCPEPDPIHTGLYSCTELNYVGSTCTLKCPGPHRVTSSITCAPDGQWDGDFTTCKFEPGECEAPSTNGTLRFICNGTQIGARCVTLCSIRDYEPIMRRRTHMRRPITLSSMGFPNDVITHVTCTGQKLWYPDENAISCVRRCNVLYQGDGVCHGFNNRAHCHWDGGDCCASTVQGGKLRLSDDACAEDCTCKDPSAPGQLQSDGNYFHQRLIYMRYEEDLNRVPVSEGDGENPKQSTPYK